jgi:hypothetical protein
MKTIAQQVRVSPRIKKKRGNAGPFNISAAPPKKKNESMNE